MRRALRLISTAPNVSLDVKATLEYTYLAWLQNEQYQGHKDVIPNLDRYVVFGH